MLGRIVSHRGRDLGTCSSILRNLDKHQTVIIYDNTDWQAGDDMARMALEILNGRQVINITPKTTIAPLYRQRLMQQDADDAY